MKHRSGWWALVAALGVVSLGACVLSTETAPGPKGDKGDKGDQGVPGPKGEPDTTAVDALQVRLDALEAKLNDDGEPGTERAWITSLSALCREYDGASPETIAAVGRAGQEHLTGSAVCSMLAADLNLGGTIWKNGYVGECVVMGYDYNRGGSTLILANATIFNQMPCSSAPAMAADSWASPTKEGSFVCCK